jgi:hypothetical protein
MKIKSIQTLEEFMDAVIIITEEKSEWDTKSLMDRLTKIIVGTMKNGQMVSAEVMIAYFNLHTVLGNKASRQRIRASASGVKSWIQDKTKSNSYGTTDSQHRELLEDQGR